MRTRTDPGIIGVLCRILTCHALRGAALSIAVTWPAAGARAAEQPAVAVEPAALVNRAVAAAGGEEKLLRLFRIKERFHFGDQPEPAPGKKASTRESVLEPPGFWWVGKKDRTDEPAKFDVWGWTLGALIDPKSRLEAVPEIMEGGKPAFGLRVGDTITPAMELYFDKERSLLVRIDWRDDVYRFSDWKEHDGAKYPSRCIIYKKKTGKPWFYHEITELERLKELPAGLTREAPPAKP